MVVSNHAEVNVVEVKYYYAGFWPHSGCADDGINVCGYIVVDAVDSTEGGTGLNPG